MTVWRLDGQPLLDAQPRPAGLAVPFNAVGAFHAGLRIKGRAGRVRTGVSRRGYFNVNPLGDIFLRKCSPNPTGRPGSGRALTCRGFLLEPCPGQKRADKQLAAEHQGDVEPCNRIDVRCGQKAHRRCGKKADETLLERACASGADGVCPDDVREPVELVGHLCGDFRINAFRGYADLSVSAQQNGRSGNRRVAIMLSRQIEEVLPDGLVPGGGRTAFVGGEGVDVIRYVSSALVFWSCCYACYLCHQYSTIGLIMVVERPARLAAVAARRG